MNLFSRIALSGLVVHGMVGCGKDKEWTKPSGPSGTMPAAQAASFPSGEGSKIMDYSTPTSSSGKTGLTSASGMTARLGRPSLRTCTPTASVTGNTADADSDGIKADATSTFTQSCTESGMTINMSGSFSEKDADDTKAFPLAGFHLGLNNLAISLTSGSTTASITGNGNYDVTVSGANIAASLAVIFSATGSSSGASGTVKFADWTDATATPDDASDPKKSGKFSFTAYYQYQATANSQNVNFVLQGTGTDLVYDSVACPSHYIKTGTATFKDGGTNTFVFTWANCTRTVTLNGNSVT